jgi:hypothetical protein
VLRVLRVLGRKGPGHDRQGGSGGNESRISLLKECGNRRSRVRQARTGLGLGLGLGLGRWLRLWLGMGMGMGKSERGDPVGKNWAPIPRRTAAPGGSRFRCLQPCRLVQGAPGATAAESPCRAVPCRAVPRRAAPGGRQSDPLCAGARGCAGASGRTGCGIASIIKIGTAHQEMHGRVSLGGGMGRNGAEWGGMGWMEIPGPDGRVGNPSRNADSRCAGQWLRAEWRLVEIDWELAIGHWALAIGHWALGIWQLIARAACAH